MNRTLRLSCLLLALVILGLPIVLAPQANAATIPVVGFTGSVFLSSSGGGGVDGTVYYTVLKNTSVVADPWGFGVTTFTDGDLSGNLDNNAAYLYLFQTVNDGTNKDKISVNSSDVPGAYVTSWGYFPGVGISTGAVVTGVANLVAPEVGNSGSSVTAGYSYSPLFTYLLAGKYSDTWAYTSNQAPTWGSTSIQDGGTSAYGVAPTTVPEPTFITLLGLAIAGVALCAWRMK